MFPIVKDLIQVKEKDDTFCCIHHARLMSFSLTLINFLNRRRKIP